MCGLSLAPQTGLSRKCAAKSGRRAGPGSTGSFVASPVRNHHNIGEEHRRNHSKSSPCPLFSVDIRLSPQTIQFRRWYQDRETMLPANDSRDMFTVNQWACYLVLLMWKILPPSSVLYTCCASTDIVGHLCLVSHACICHLLEACVSRSQYTDGRTPTWRSPTECCWQKARMPCYHLTWGSLLVVGFLQTIDNEGKKTYWIAIVKIWIPVKNKFKDMKKAAAEVYLLDELKYHAVSLI